MELSIQKKVKANYTKTTIWVILLATGICLLGSSIWRLIIEKRTPPGPIYGKGELFYSLIAIICIAILLFLISFIGTINSTLSRENILNNTTRAKIYSLIETQPGIHFSEIIRTLKLGKGQADWHLLHLKRFELITQIRSEQYLLFYSNTNSSKEKALVRYSTIFKSATREQIYKLIANRTATTQKEIKEQLHISQSSIAYHLGILEQEDLIYSDREKRIRYYYPKNNLNKIHSDNSLEEN